MRSQEFLDTLSDSQKEAIAREYSARVGGTLLSPNRWKDAVNTILSEITGQTVNLPAGTLNAIVNRIL
jgi:hypothetical protein